MLVAELDEVAHIGLPVVDPVHNVVHVGEFGVTAAREPAPLVAPPDLNPLGVAGVPSGSSEVETLPTWTIGRDHDLGVTGQPAGDAPGDRPQHVEVGTTFAPDEEAVVGVDDDGRPVAVQSAGPGLGRTAASPAGGVSLADGHQSVGHPLIEGGAVTQTATGPGDE